MGSSSSGTATTGGSGGSPAGGSHGDKGEAKEETEVAAAAAAAATADAVFRDAMRRKGLTVVDVEPDGNCLFRSVSHQIYGDAERHFTVRRMCVDHMSKHRARFGVFVAEDFRDYLYRIRQTGVWGDDLEIRFVFFFFSGWRN